MPTQQFPIISAEGIVQGGDTGSAFNTSTMPYPYYLNGYFEKTESQTPSRQYAYIKRSGLRIAFSGFDNNSKVLGTLGHPSNSHYYVVTAVSSGAVKLCHLDTSLTLTSTAITADGWSSTAPYTFYGLDPNTFNNFSVVFTDLNKAGLCQIDGSGYTLITDADFTGLSKVTNILGMGGYLYVGTSNGRLYNSDLNQPTSWTATSFLVPADVPGKLTWLGRLRNFLIVFKERSIEFFEDIGNPTPGSPLEPRKQLNRNIGCVLPSSIQEVSDGLIFAGTNHAGVCKIYKIDRDSLQITPISNRMVEQGLVIYNFTNSYSSDASVNSAGYKAQSQVFMYAGKEFYMLNASPPIANSFTAASLVYDNSLGLWTNFQSSLSTQFAADSHGFNAWQSRTLLVASQGEVLTLFVDNGNSGASAPPRLLYMPSPTLSFSSTNYTDVGNGYTFAWTSDIIDLNTRSRKFMDWFELFYTCNQGATPSNATTDTISLIYRDIDFDTNNEITRTLGIDPGGGLRAYATRLGSFRRRVFSVVDQRITAGSSLPLTLWGFEISYNMGETDQD